jgi:DNA invertase Pin-like site-specific DNA recombinase
MNGKITLQHRLRQACIYVRQSTPGQLRLNPQSTERQYQLKEKALELGWAPSMIRVLDRDLGISGSSMSQREDFKELVSGVSMGQVGGVFALEASRLSRSCVDWHRLLELCALSATLIIDEDGVYDPIDFNDQLVLGLKGTMSQAELHLLRARLQGGKLNKARKGQLRFPLPVGLCYDPEGRTILDPDEQVRGILELFFQRFEELKSACAVVRQFAEQGLQFPKRAYGGVWDGQLMWGRLEHNRALGLLKNPRYAGCYVYGQYRTRKSVSAEGQMASRMFRLPMEEWEVVIRDHHPGYISWERYLSNQERLERNRTNGPENMLRGPAREGHALLQGLLLCKKCGRRLSVRYKGNGGIYPTYECNWHHRQGLSGHSCMQLRCNLLDEPVCRRVLEVFEPAQVQIALQALEELEKRQAALQRQWDLRFQRAEYEAQLAQRRYEEVDPSNRLVATTLESRWNQSLENVEELKKDYAESCAAEGLALTAQQRERILALARDLPRVWRAPSTKNKDRKEMLRLVIKDITVQREKHERSALLHIRWQGGACEQMKIEIPPPRPEQIRYKAEVIEQVRELARYLPDAQITSTLNEQGTRSAKGLRLTVSMIKWIRFKHQIPAPELREPGELSVKELAEKLAVNPSVVYYWARRGILKTRRVNNGSRCWIRIDAEKEDELMQRVRESTKLKKICSASRTPVE